MTTAAEYGPPAPGMLLCKRSAAARQYGNLDGAKRPTATRVLLATTLLLACGGGLDDSSKAEVVVDTLPSGRILVRNPAPATAAAVSWSLEPQVRIGAVDGVEAYVFGRIVDVALGPEGHVYVLDAQAREIRVFDGAGAHLRTIGSAGQGPGELSSPYGFSFDAAGRLWVADAGNRRFTSFSTTGEVIALHRSPLRGGIARGQMRLDAAGRVLDFDFLPGVGLAALKLALEEPARVQETLPLPPWAPRGFTRMAGTETLIVTPPITPGRLWDLSAAEGLWIATSDEYVLHHLAFSGDTTLTITLDSPATRLTEQDRTRQLGWADSVRAEGFSGDNATLPTSYPHFSRVIAADDGSLWTYHETPGGAGFHVFDAGGLFVATVATELRAGQGGVHPHITGEQVVGVVVDELGVQYVQVSRIRK